MAIKRVDLKNFARGGNKYPKHRLDIARQLLDSEQATLAPLSDFNRDRLFLLTPSDWSLFAFSDRDWEVAQRLRESKSPQLEVNMLRMLSAYVSVNADAVRKLYVLNATISARVLAESAYDLAPGTDLLSAVDMQSLFAIRVECALRQTSADTIRDRLREIFTSGWCRVRLLYPLVYHFVNRTPSTGLDSFLSYVMTGKEHAAETEAIKLILSDEAARHENLAFKAYVGLMGHPYDACEIALDHIEYQLGRDRDLPDHLAEFLREAAQLFPGTRAERLFLSTVPGTLPLTEEIDTGALAGWIHLPEKELKCYALFAHVGGHDPGRAPPEADVDRPRAILGRMRGSAYPIPADFARIVLERFIWSFTDAGRFLGALLRSIYMVERTERDLEVRDVQRLAQSIGRINAFVATAPSAMFALRLMSRRARGVAAAPAAIEKATETALGDLRPSTDRLWINDIQWRLRRLEEAGRITDWLEVVRGQVLLRPSFLSGINWEWVEEIVRLERLSPFVSFSGAYLFLLMEGETPNFDPLRLRFTLEPLLRDQKIDEIVVTFIREYGETAAAFVRRYLSTENLLASGLAPNYVAALDMRVRALEACIRANDYGPLLTASDYESEERALTSELLLTNVNTGKFEIPWDTFRKDAIEKQQQLFAVVSSLRPREGDEPALSAIVETPHSFPNGRTQIYRYRLSQAPLFSLVVALVGDFMEHPAFGIEVILSGRFRHSNLLQELWTAIMSVSGATIPSVTVAVQRELTNQYRDAMERCLEDWCARRLHTIRREKPEGLFDLVPGQGDMDELLVSVSPLQDLPEITEEVIGWIKNRLRSQVDAARAQFVQEVTDDLSARLGLVRDEQAASGGYREQDVTKVHSAVVDGLCRRIEDLQSWFDGVDAVPTTSISLADLSIATETLFENMIDGMALRARVDATAENVWFSPDEVKIAFDMLREIYYNALRRGRGPEVTLAVRRLAAQDRIVYAFSNRIGPDHEAGESAARFEGSRYTGRDDALFREGNSGRPKVAASSATLLGEDTAICSIVRHGTHHLVVPLRRMARCPD